MKSGRNPQDCRILEAEPTTMRGIFSKDTSWVIKLFFIYFPMLIVSSVIPTLLSNRTPFGASEKYLWPFYFVAGLLGFFSLLLRWRRLTIAAYLIYIVANLAMNVFIEPGFSFVLSWSVVRTAETILTSLIHLSVGVIFLFFLLKSSGVKAYFKGQPLAQDEREEQARLIKTLPITIFGIAFFAMCVCQLVLFHAFDKTLDSKDREGLSIQGNAEIKILRGSDGALSFAWDGNPVSYAKIEEEDSAKPGCKTTIWTAAAKKNKDDCLRSPVRYQRFDNACGRSTEPILLVKWQKYTVFISTSYNLTDGNYPTQGWASREFRY